MSRVSVIMPVFNGMNYFAEAMESVLCQSLRDLLIVVYDGTIDATRTIAARLRDRTVCLHLANGGPGGGRSSLPLCRWRRKSILRKGLPRLGAPSARQPAQLFLAPPSLARRIKR
ncbi:glycosyltransferase [bacterium]|nr:glycosyltransferase [bacterium]